MDDSLYLSPCPFIKKELELILASGKYPEAVMKLDSQETVFNSEEAVSFSIDLKVLRLGCASTSVNIKKTLETHHDCIDLITGKHLSVELKKSHHLLLPSMISHLLRSLETGDDKSFFLKLNAPLVIDTGVSPQLERDIKRIEELTGTKISVHPLSLEHFEQILQAQVETWRQYQNTALINESLFQVQKEKANYAIILDFIGRIQRFETEKKIIDELFDLVVMLTSTNDVYFSNQDNEIQAFSTPPSKELKSDFLRWLTSEGDNKNDWFLFKMNYREKYLGTLFIRSGEIGKMQILQTLLAALMNFTALAIDKIHNMNELAGKKEVQAINAMVATYNHEINNPLSIAVGYLSIAEKKQDFKYLAEVKEALNKITEIVQKISEITDKGPSFADYTKQSQRLKID